MRELEYLLESINSLCKSLNYDYSINSGGCCYLSAIIAKHLDRLGIDYDLVIYDDSTKRINDIRNEIFKHQVIDEITSSVIGEYTCHHYCLRIGRYGIINDTSRKGDYKYIISNVSSKNIRWIYKNGDWNQWYDVKNNRTIRNKVNKFFKEYEKTSSLQS